MHTYLLVLFIATLCGGFAVVIVADAAITIAATTVKASAAFVGYILSTILDDHITQISLITLSALYFLIEQEGGYPRSESFPASGISSATNRWPECGLRGMGDAPFS